MPVCLTLCLCLYFSFSTGQFYLFVKHNLHRSQDYSHILYNNFRVVLVSLLCPQGGRPVCLVRKLFSKSVKHVCASGFIYVFPRQITN